MSFALKFNQKVDAVHWPRNLHIVVFPDDFDDMVSVERAKWPSTLEAFEFGSGCGWRVSDTTWPTSLKTLVLGGKFNTKVYTLQWPPGLESLAFGGSFNHSRVMLGSYPEGVVVWQTLPTTTVRRTLAESYSRTEV